jgi:alpha-tubulin suppressor-like RCC1 family protein
MLVLSAPAEARRSGRGGSITIRIRALPRGVHGAVTLAHRGRVRRLRHSRTVRHLRPGRYTLTAKRVSTRKLTYYPTVTSCPVVNRCRPLRRGRVKLERRGRLKLYAVYEDIVPKTTRVLSAASVRRIAGGMRRNGDLTFRGSAPLPFGKGSVIVAAPSSRVPYGLMRKVTGIARHGTAAVVSTTAATLVEAVPRGAFRVRAGSPVADSATSRDDGASSSTKSFPCDTSSISLSTSQHFTSRGWQLSASWGPTSKPQVTLSGSFDVDADASVFGGVGFDCSVSAEWPPSPDPGEIFLTRTVNVGPVPVWVTPELVGKVAFSGGLRGGLTLSAGGTATVGARVGYADGAFSHSFSATPSLDGASVSLKPGVTGGADLSVGPKLYLDIDDNRLIACLEFKDCDEAAGTPYLDLLLNPALAIQPSLEPWWRLDAKVKVGVGLVIPLLGLDARRDFEIWKAPLLGPPGRPTSVSALAGSQGARIVWQPPAANPATPPQDPCRCLPVSGYTVLVDGKPAATTSGATSAMLTGLVNGVTYRVTVEADSAQGLSSDESVPIMVTPGAARPPLGATAVSIGWGVSCAIEAGGRAYCWGSNALGQLGIGTGIGPQSCTSSPCSTTPVPVSGLTNVTAIMAGAIGACAVLSTGGVDCWGLFGPGGDNCAGYRSPDPCTTTPAAVPGINNATAVADVALAACVLVATGNVGCWGDNGWGELGDGTNFAAEDDPDRCADNPTPIGYPCGSATPVPVSGISDAVGVSGGQEHACAVLAGGTVECWGDNQVGELGEGTDTGPTQCGPYPCSRVPVPVSGITNAIAVSAGEYHTCALLADGRVECWGENVFGQLGNGTSTGPQNCAETVTYACSTTPVVVSGITDAVALAAGRTGACALRRGGRIVCWGMNYAGELGNGIGRGPEFCHPPHDPNDWPCATTPVPVTGVTDATRITAGEHEACAILANGAIECWGANVYGQLGDGLTSDSAVPVEAKIP